MLFFICYSAYSLMHVFLAYPFVIFLTVYAYHIYMYTYLYKCRSIHSILFTINTCNVTKCFDIFISFFFNKNISLAVLKCVGVGKYVYACTFYLLR